MRRKSVPSACLRRDVLDVALFMDGFSVLISAGVGFKL
jgi:hypothetical protein